MFSGVFGQAYLMSLGITIACVPMTADGPLCSWIRAGIVEATEVAGKVVLKQLRGHGINPYTDAMTIARLIWKEEVSELLRNAGTYHGMSGANREILYYRLLRTLGPVEVKQRVCHILRHRTGWRGAYKAA